MKSSVLILVILIYYYLLIAFGFNWRKTQGFLTIFSPFDEETYLSFKFYLDSTYVTKFVFLITETQKYCLQNLDLSKFC